jgi:hypothetical protein
MAYVPDTSDSHDYLRPKIRPKKIVRHGERRGMPRAKTPEEWTTIELEYLQGATTTELADKHQVNQSTISRNVSQKIKMITTVAKDLFSAETDASPEATAAADKARATLEKLPKEHQESTKKLIDQLRSMTTEVVGAANYGAKTAHVLAQAANKEVEKLNMEDPDANNHLVARNVMALSTAANKALEPALAVLAGNKEASAKALQDITANVDFAGINAIDASRAYQRMLSGS